MVARLSRAWAEAGMVMSARYYMLERFVAIVARHDVAVDAFARAVAENLNLVDGEVMSMADAVADFFATEGERQLEAKFRGLLHRAGELESDDDDGGAFLMVLDEIQDEVTKLCQECTLMREAKEPTARSAAPR